MSVALPPQSATARPCSSVAVADEWERLVHTAAHEQRQAGGRAAGAASLQHFHSPPPRGDAAAASTTPPPTPPPPPPLSVHTAIVRAGFPHSDATMAASASSFQREPSGAANPRSSSSSSPTPALLAGVHACLSSLVRLAQGERRLDAMRERLHSLPCIRPIESEALQFPGGEAWADSMRGGYKAGSWLSRRVAASSPLFQSKLHTLHHAVAGLPGSDGGGAVFVPNTFLLWLFFHHLDTAGKGYVSVEDLALFLAKNCRREEQSAFQGSEAADRVIASNHEAQMEMERYLHEQIDEEEHGQVQRGAARYPSPFRHHAGIVAAVEIGQRQQQQQESSRGVLDSAYSFLSASTADSAAASPHRPPMPRSEDILALFRKHDRSSHGRMGFAQFCRALVPLLPTHPIHDDFEASLAELPQQFSHFVEPSNNPLPAASNNRGPNEHAAANPVAPWSTLAPTPSSLQGRLSLAQEGALLDLLLAEIQIESELNFEDLNLQQMGQGKGASAVWQAQAAEQWRAHSPRSSSRHGFSPSDRPPSLHSHSCTFDLIDLFVYLDLNGDGFLTFSELRHAFAKFGLDPSSHELAYILYRADKDNDSKIVFLGWADIFLPYANVRPYDPESVEAATNRSRSIDPRAPFPCFELPTLPPSTLHSLLFPPAEPPSVEEQIEQDNLAADEAEMERQRVRTEAAARVTRERERQRQQQQAARTRRSRSDGEEDAQLSPDKFNSPAERKHVSFGGEQGPTYTPSPQWQQQQHLFVSPASDPQRQAWSPLLPPTLSSTLPSPLSPVSRPSSSPRFRPPPPLPSEDSHHFDPHLLPLHSSLFHRPVPQTAVEAAHMALRSVVANMAPELSSSLPVGYPFVLTKPLSPEAPIAAAASLALSPPSHAQGGAVQTIAQIRAEQLRAYQRFSEQAVQQQRKHQQHMWDTRINHTAPSPSRSPAQPPISDRAGFSVHSATSHFSPTALSSSGFRSQPVASPFSIPTVVSPPRPSTAAAVAFSPSLPPPSLWEPTASNYAVAASMSSSVPSSPRFAPSYPLRFPAETLASRVHQTLCFPIPLAVPSAMLPLRSSRTREQRSEGDERGESQLTAEIAHAALVASMASTQSRAAEATLREQQRRNELHSRAQQVTTAMAHMHSHHQQQQQQQQHSWTMKMMLTPPTSSEFARHAAAAAAPLAAAQAAMLPMNYQDTSNHYAGVAEWSALNGGAGHFASPFLSSGSFVRPAASFSSSHALSLSSLPPDFAPSSQPAAPSVSLASVQSYRRQLQQQEEEAAREQQTEQRAQAQAEAVQSAMQLDRTRARISQTLEEKQAHHTPQQRITPPSHGDDEATGGGSSQSAVAVAAAAAAASAQPSGGPSMTAGREAVGIATPETPADTLPLRAAHTFTRIQLPSPTRSSAAPTSSRAYARSPYLATPPPAAATTKPLFLSLHDLASPTPAKPQKSQQQQQQQQQSQPADRGATRTRLQAAIAGSNRHTQQPADDASPTRNLTHSFTQSGNIKVK